MNIVRKYKLKELGYEIDSESDKIIDKLERELFELKQVHIEHRNPYRTFYSNSENVVVLSYEKIQKFFHMKNAIFTNICIELNILENDDYLNSVIELLSYHYQLAVDGITPMNDYLEQDIDKNINKNK